VESRACAAARRLLHADWHSRRHRGAPRAGARRPHRDLAAAALALVPRERLSDSSTWMFRIVDDRSGSTCSTSAWVGIATGDGKRVAHLQREFDGFWVAHGGCFPFRRARALRSKSGALRRGSAPRPRSATQILDVPAMLARRSFRQQVLKRTRDPALRQWFDGTLRPGVPTAAGDLNPVQTKVHKYLGSLVLDRSSGSRGRRSTPQLIAEHKIVLINLNAFDVGEDVAALSVERCSTWRHAPSRLITARPGRRQPVTLIVDEFHTLPAPITSRCSASWPNTAPTCCSPRRRFALGPTHGCAPHPRSTRGGVFQP